MRYTLRPGRPSDLPYVVDTWAKRGHAQDERIGAAVARVRAILARPDAQLRIACLPDDEDAILGWASVDLGAAKAHYVYVRKDARGQGIATTLLCGIPFPG